MSFDPVTHRAAVDAKIRSSRRNQIILPFLGGVVFLVVLVILAAISPRLNVTSSVMLTIFMICPMVIILFAFFILLVAAVFSMGKLNGLVGRPMARLETLTAELNDRVMQVTSEVNRQTVNLSTRTAPFEERMNQAFEQKPARKETSDE